MHLLAVTYACLGREMTVGAKMTVAKCTTPAEIRTLPFKRLGSFRSNATDHTKCKLEVALGGFSGLALAKLYEAQ
jgi:hypothetical protein